MAKGRRRRPLHHAGGHLFALDRAGQPKDRALCGMPLEAIREEREEPCRVCEQTRAQSW